MLSERIFTPGIMKLGDVFNKKITESIIHIYYDALEKFTDEQFTRCVDYLIKNHKYPTLPLPADFIEAKNNTRPEVTGHEFRIEANKKGSPIPPEVKEQMDKLCEKMEMKRKRT